MIDLYTWTTPNGYKVSVMLEECGLEYAVHPIDIHKGEQFKPDFVRICPNSKVPAIVDRGGEGGEVSVFESGAILQYLAEKTGKLLPAGGAARAKVLEWTFWQMANLGPMLGQANYFANTAEEKVPSAIERYLVESARLFKVMDDQLGRAEYLAGDYSIADVACYAWTSLGFGLIRNLKPDVVGDGANLERWIASIGARPAVAKGMAVPDGG